MLRFFFGPGVHSIYTSLTLAVVRISTGGLLLVGHGWEKLVKFNEMSASFPDPLGAGSAVSLGLVIFAEVFCAGLIILGLLTRFAAIPLAIQMGVAVFVFHVADEFSKRELPALYLIIFILLLATGGGRFSIDALITKRSAPPSNTD